jgi:hypothetical protein
MRTNKVAELNYCHSGLSGIFPDDSEQIGLIPDEQE